MWKTGELSNSGAQALGLAGAGRPEICCGVDCGAWFWESHFEMGRVPEGFATN